MKMEVNGVKYETKCFFPDRATHKQEIFIMHKLICGGSSTSLSVYE